MIKKSVSWVMILSLVLVSMLVPARFDAARASSDLTLTVDGVDITSLSAPVIVNDRTLVPVRFVAEQLGANVEWDGEAYTVTITKGERTIFLTIGSHLVEYDNGASCIVSDVAPRIINDRTYVPIRLISNAFGIGISWDDATRTVSVESNKTSSVETLYDFDITSISHGDTLTGAVQIDFNAGDNLRSVASQTKLILMETGSTEGLVIGRISSDADSIEYIPSPNDNGQKILVVALYNESNEFVAGAAVSVFIDVTPEIEVTGADRMEYIRETVGLGVDANFPIYAVEYEIVHENTGRTTKSGRIDPLSAYNWTPAMEDNGLCTIKATVYDKGGNAYEGSELVVIAGVTRKISLAGVSEGMLIDKPVSLIASRNFYVDETTYLLRNPDTGRLSVIATVPYGSIEWFPGPEFAGEQGLGVMVLDTKGVHHYSSFVDVTVSDSPQFIFKGLGPGQVLTSSANLSVKSNVEPESVRYKLTDLDSGSSRYLDGSGDSSGSVAFSPSGSDDGRMAIQAEAVYEGTIYKMPSVEFNVFLGTTYGPMPIVAKEQFTDFASGMAVESMNETGMSAALQTAQAILETGWGQSVPVDKYTGQFSHNLFGVKGEGTNGSVISNTWEVYNGVSFRVDDYFRAYETVEEAWADHKEFLLNLSRYEGFRSVMHDYAEGASALRQAGYATDPKYAIKLLDIINRYDLWLLDMEGF